MEGTARCLAFKSFAAPWPQDYATGRLEANQRLRARQLRDLLTSLGPAFVKVGQALSSRPDLLPQSYLEVPPTAPPALSDPSVDHSVAIWTTLGQVCYLTQCQLMSLVSE